MLRKVIAGSLGVLLATSGSMAFADHRGYEYAPVVDVEPIVRQVRVRAPVQECWDEVQYEAIDDWPGRRGASPAMIAGGILGGVFGHQFGRGRGKDVATVAGAVIGSAVAHNVAAQRHGPPRYEAVTVERCETRYEYHTEEHIDGYRVTYEFLGKEYTTRTREYPGEHIRVRVSVAPA